jgi:hypothetical protein
MKLLLSKTNLFVEKKSLKKKTTIQILKQIKFVSSELLLLSLKWSFGKK